MNILNCDRKGKKLVPDVGLFKHTQEEIDLARNIGKGSNRNIIMFLF